jgi:hypothetical protein
VPIRGFPQRRWSLPYYPPVPFVDDVDANAEMDARVHDGLLSPCIDATATAIKKDFKNLAKDAHGRRFVVAGLLETMKDVHEVVRNIYAAFPGSQQLCAFPLARQQIELLFIGIALLRKGNEYHAIYEKASMANAYEYFLYQAEETKNLSGREVDHIRRGALFQGKMRNLQSPFTDEEIKSIEDFVLCGEKKEKKNRVPDPPGPMDIIKDLGSNPDNEPLVRVLCRLYVEYQWLCEYTHCDLWAQSTRQCFGSSDPDVDEERLMRNVTREPILYLSYLAILTALTESSLHFADPVAVRARLCQLWEPFENACFLGQFIWRNWARSAMGILDVSHCGVPATAQ